MKGEENGLVLSRKKVEKAKLILNCLNSNLLKLI